MTNVDEIRDQAVRAWNDVQDYLASDEGRRMRAKVAAGLMVAAPLIARLPVMRASKLGKLIGFAGGAALVVKAAEMIRDWEPATATTAASASPAS